MQLHILNYKCTHNIIVGKLSHWLQTALGNSAKDVHYLLIDRASNRYKVQ